MRPTTTTARKCQLRLAWIMLLFVGAVSGAYAQVPKLNSYASTRATVLLDFDGHNVQGTAWNWEGAIMAKHCGLSNQQILEIFNRVSEDFRIFNLNITTDPAVFSRAPLGKRMRIIVTPTYQWYGHAGGVAFVNSFTWGDDTPAFVFTTLLNDNAKFIAEAVSHEIGHTLGLQHQSTYDRHCGLVSEYSGGKGEGEVGWAPIMGVGYYKNFTTWTYGASIEGCKIMQNDISIISKGLNQIGLRADDHGDTRSAATNLMLVNNRFETIGIINHAPDKDVFKVQLVKKGRVNVSATPFNLGGANDGANLDMQMYLIKSTGDTIRRINPKLSLSGQFDTLLNAGTYYLAVDGSSNQNVSDYGSVGFYVMRGVVTPASTGSPVVMTGMVRQNMHMLSWNVNDFESVTKSYLEYSTNGESFIPVSELPASTTEYTNKPLTNGNVFYRLRMVLPDETFYYSNSILLTNGAVSVLNNRVTSQVQLNASGDYNYQVLDETGRIFQKGKLSRGLNTVALNTSKQGLLLLKVFNHNEQLAFKLIKQ